MTHVPSTNANLGECKFQEMLQQRTYRSLDKLILYPLQLGMAHLLQSAHWFYEDNVASVKYPRSYNLTRDAEAFVDDYRRTAAAGLLKWYVEMVKNGKDILGQGETPIPIARVDFAVNKLQDFVASEMNENLDGQEVYASSQEWDEFLNDCEKILHGDNGIDVTSPNPTRILQVT